MPSGHECKFATPFDTNGALYYIGNDRVVAAMSSIMDGGSGHSSTKHSGPSRLVLHKHDGSTVNFTQGKAHSWVSVDLGVGRCLVVSNYCLRHGASDGRYRLQSWDFEGSNDDSSYTVLTAHKNDNSLPDQGFSEAAWEVEGVKQAYRYFRIRMTGKTSNGNYNLCCAGIELYGILLSR
jgi:hypothetical protein